MSTKIWQAREEVLEWAMRLMAGRVDVRGPGPHDDAEAEYAEDELVKAAEVLVQAKNLERREHGKEQKDTVGNPGEELLRRLSSAWATYVRLQELFDEDAIEELDKVFGTRFDPVGSLLSALSHDFAGTQGCLDDDEWEIKRRAHAIAYINSNAIAPLPVPLADPPTMHSVRGSECPMGCGETLRLGDDGYLVCSYQSCPNPTAVSEMLSPAARAQQHKESEDRMKLEIETGKRITDISENARTLIEELKGAWWLKAAGAYGRLDELTRLP